MDINDETELERVQNEVLRRIGRNVYLLQLVEVAIKGLNFSSEIQGPINNLVASQDARQEAIFRKTLGPACKEFTQSVYVKKGSKPPPPKRTDESGHPASALFSYKSWIAGDEDNWQKFNDDLNALVHERNELVHHLPKIWNPDSLESGKQLAKQLEEQRTRIDPVLAKLRDFHKAGIEAAQEFKLWLLTDEANEEFALARLRQSQLIAWLYDIAQRPTRKDGWLVFDQAKQVIRDNVPSELENIKQFGYDSLMSAVIATGYFDVDDEITKKGGKRVIFRIKPGLIFDD